MKKNMIIMGLALLFANVINAGSFGSSIFETVAGDTSIGYAQIHNNNENPIWAALITHSDKRTAVMDAVEVVEIPAGKGKTGIKAETTLPIQSHKTTTLAIWNTNPSKVEASNGWLGLKLYPKPTNYYKFTLPENQNVIYFEINGNKITEQKQ